MPDKKNEGGFLPPYRVLDLTDEKGVYCGKLLGDLGADVIKIEHPRGDKLRFRAPFYQGNVHLEKSLPFLYFNTSKGSITLNIDNSGGQAILKRLVEKADVVIESFPVGYLASLGIDYHVLKKINPKLVMSSITPFGQKGSLSGCKATDINIMAMGGYMQLIGDPDKQPLVFGGEQSFYPGAMFAATGIVFALFYRDSISGKGQYIDVSMQEAIINFIHEQLPAARWALQKENVSRDGPMDAMLTPCGLYPCKDGWISLCMVTAKEWDALSLWMYEVTGKEEVLDERYKGDLLARMLYRDTVNAMVADFTARLTSRELFLEGQRRNVAVTPANHVPDLMDDTQLSARDFWIELDHPAVGKMKYPKGALYSDIIGPPRKAAPLIGEDNERIYCSEMGYSKEDLAILRTQGIV